MGVNMVPWYPLMVSIKGFMMECGYGCEHGTLVPSYGEYKGFRDGVGMGVSMVPWYPLMVSIKGFMMEWVWV